MSSPWLLANSRSILAADPEENGLVVARYQHLLRLKILTPTSVLIPAHTFSRVLEIENTAELLNEQLYQKYLHQTLDWTSLAKACQKILEDVNFPDAFLAELVTTYHSLFRNQAVTLIASVVTPDHCSYPVPAPFTGDTNLLEHLRVLWQRFYDTEHIGIRFAEWQRHQPFLFSVLIQHREKSLASGMCNFAGPRSTIQIVENQDSAKLSEAHRQKLSILAKHIQQELHPLGGFAWSLTTRGQILVTQLFDHAELEWLNK